MSSKIKKYSKNSIKSATKSLQNGSIIIIPTDTLYGIAANAQNNKAVNNIFKVKKRPKTFPLIIFVRSIEAAKKIAKFSKLDNILAHHFWPGPITLILKKKKINIHNGDKRLSKIGIRIPKNKVVESLLEKSKMYLSTTSANLHKEKNIKKIENLKIIANNNVEMAILGKEKMTFQESTLVETSDKEVRILRKGQINPNEIRKVLKLHGYLHKIK